MGNKISIAIAAIIALVVSTPSWADFYVDPDYAGGNGVSDGSAEKPWTKCDSATEWNVIDAALASADVTVYFSASADGASADETSASTIKILRSDASTHRVTLDGMAKWCADDATPEAADWQTYSGSARYNVTATVGITTTAQQTSHYYTVRGFKLNPTGGGNGVYHWAGNHVVIEYLQIEAINATSGPIVYVQYKRKNGDFEIPCVPDNDHSCVSNEDITIRNNVLNNAYGEAIYIGGINERRCELCSTDERHRINETAHNGITIQDNIIYNAGVGGGEGDGIDIKPGNTNVQIIGNTVYWSSPAHAASDNGIIVDCGAKISGNYVYYAGYSGIKLASYWNTYPSRSGTSVFNNIVCKTGGGAGTQDNGILVEYFCEDITNGVNAQFKWEASGAGTNEYYLTWVDGDDPDGFDPSLGIEPNYLYMAGARATNGTLGSLADHEWDYGDNDTLGYDTIYFRDDSGDPDAVDPDLCMEYDQFNDVLIYNNTVVEIQNDGVSEGGITTKFPAYNYGGSIKNNIVADCLGTALFFNGTAVPNHSHNCLHGSSGNVYNDGTDTVAFDAGQAALRAVDPNSVIDAPLLLTDHTPAIGSPVVGAGTDLSAYFTTDYSGRSWLGRWGIGARVGGGWVDIGTGPNAVTTVPAGTPGSHTITVGQ